MFKNNKSLLSTFCVSDGSGILFVPIFFGVKRFSEQQDLKGHAQNITEFL